MESKELMTKRRIEQLAEQYEGWRIPKSSLFDNKNSYEVFVSHSSTDKEFINKVLLFLYHAKGGVQGYVDWQDSEMQHPTNADTAKALKERIRGARKLIYVVTNDSLKSVWCSWELGFADSEKGVDNVALLAIRPSNGYWRKNEYLQQYPWISYGNNLFRINMPDGSSQSLYDWLKK